MGSEWLVMEITRNRCDERAEARRQQILDAAAVCFRDHGFHSASIANIARTAGMSVGHIYHYFENKEAVIAAIVASDEDHVRERFEEFRNASDLFNTLVERADGGLERSLDVGRSALVMEVLAEAGRNPRVAGIVEASDRVIGAELREIIEEAWRSQHPGRTPDPVRLDAQVELIGAVFDGLRARAIRHPGLNREAVLALLKPVLRRILEG